jgi:hypothetical protein
MLTAMRVGDENCRATRGALGVQLRKQIEPHI